MGSVWNATFEGFLKTQLAISFFTAKRQQILNGFLVLDTM